MKKLYFFTLLFLSSLAAMAQTVYSENFGTTAPSSSPYPLVDAYTGYQMPAANYSGTADVRSTGAATPGGDYSGSSNVFFATTVGRSLLIQNINTSAYPSSDLVLSFTQNQGSNSATPATNLLVEVSTDGVVYTPLTYTRTSNTGWNLITIGGGVIPSATNLRVRFTQNSTIQYRIDDFKIRVVSASCTLALGTVTSTCNATTLSDDTVLVTIPYTGGGNATYTVTATGPNGTVAVTGNPSTVAAGDLTMTVTESTPITLTITGGTCNTSLSIVAAACKPINTLPFNENFDYLVDAPLTSQQKWSVANTGDNVTISAANLSYTGVTSSGKSAMISGAGAEAWTPFTPTSTGTIYSSFLMSVTDMTNITADGNETVFFALTGNDAATYRARVFIKRAGEQYVLGLASSGTTTTNYTSSAFNVNDVVLVVVNYDFTANVLKAWINPPLATFNPATTPATLTETPATALAVFGGAILRQDDATHTPTIIIDELRVSTDFATLSNGRNNEEITGLRIYPNPLTGSELHIVSNSNTEKAVAIYDVLGKQVVNTTTVESVNVSGLNSGVYIVKITEEGKTATKKLVIR